MAVLNAVWVFFQTQILGMRWLNSMIGVLLTRLGVDLTTRLGGSLQFFIYDVAKIFILLSVLIFTISYIQSHFPPERTKVILGRFKGIKGNLMGALLGTITPFCSCSSIPLFIGFTNAGLPLGITFSFLISSPLVDLAAFLLLMSIFGLKIALTYVIVGLVLAVAGGTIIDRLGLEDQVEEFVRSTHMAELEGQELTKRDRLLYAKEQMLATINKVWPYILVGVGIGALIHNWVPADVIQRVVGQKNPFSVILATAVGIPMYADIFGTIPVAEALYLKGVGVGTVLSFMMAVTALSLPSMIMLRRAIKPKLLGIFIAIVSVGIIIIGYTFNALGYLFA